MTEHPQNLRPSRPAERTHNSGYHHGESRRGEDHSASRSYSGSHRAEHTHRGEDTGSIAHQRSSRVGRHHNDDQHPGHTSRRWRTA